MALSPAQRHSQRHKAEQQLKQRRAIETMESLHMQMQMLDQDVAYVRALPTIADRVAYKRDELLPRWNPTIDAYLEGGHAYENPVFAWISRLPSNSRRRRTSKAVSRCLSPIR